MKEKELKVVNMSDEYKAMFEDWKNHSDDFQNLLVDYEDVDDEMMPWSEIYRRANALFKEKVWYQQSCASPLDEPTAQEENYKNTVKALKKEHKFNSSTFDDYTKKFKQWLNAYPAVQKKRIIDENEQNWSAIYKIFHKIFKNEVWNEYSEEMSANEKADTKN